MGISEINEKLVNSCNSLNREGIIQLEDTKRCRKIQRSSKIPDKSFEKNIFKENREEDRLKKLDNIHNYFSEKIETEFKKLETELNGVTDTDAIKKVLNDSELGNIFNLMKLIMIETDKKIINRYNTNEDINYDALLNNYSKIDINRKKMEQIGKSYDTLLKVNDTEFEKLNNSSYTFHLIGVFVLLAVIIGLVIYIVKFMKI